jgi:ParB family chromosome partitioning protein
MEKRPALGKGLSALIPDTPEPTRPSAVEADIDRLEPNDFQPRVHVDDARLHELAQSIRANGIIQPIVVRKVGDRFQIIAGERRWRAAKVAGLLRVPVVVRDVAPGTEQSLLEMALIENIQREDLNPIEAARAFERLMDEFDLTQDLVAERTGKDRTTVANAVRLLKLESTIQEWIEEGKLSAGHGRALLAVIDPQLRMRYAQRAARGGLTVRQIERLASRRARGQRAAAEGNVDANIKAALEDLQRHLSTKILLHQKTKVRPGQLILEYYDDAQLMGLYDRLMK